MRATYDPEVDAAYIALTDPGPGQVAHTITLDEHPDQPAVADIGLDFTEDGRLVGYGGRQ